MRTTLATGNDRRRDRRAFTLIELTIVIFIMMVLSMAAAPSFVRSYNTSQLNAAGRALATTCQFARLHAAMQQQTVTLNLDLDRQVYWVTEPVRADAEGDTGSTLKTLAMPGRVALASVTTSDGVSYQQGEVHVAFYPNGTCDGVTVTFVGAEKRDAVAVEVDSVTGRASTYEVR